jgi:ABC-2 type transport system ATP-binding protein
MTASNTLHQPIVETRLPQRPPSIQLQALRHLYGDRVALAGVSFDVRPAEIFGLLGPNGSGKTTTFRILSTLMLPSGGRALIMGHDVAREPALVRRNIGVVFQAQSIDIKLSAEENLMLIGHIYGLRGAALKKRVSEMLNRVGLADRAKEKAETFSGGMQRRLELAKGLLHHPSVLLLDEPTTGLDPGARRDLWQYLQILRDEERVTVLGDNALDGRSRALRPAGHLRQWQRCWAGHAGGVEERNRRRRDYAGIARTGFAGTTNRTALRAASHGAGSSRSLEIESGHRFVTDVVEAFPGEIEGVSVHKPSLEDVFIRRTGHRFWTEESDAETKE